MIKLSFISHQQYEMGTAPMRKYLLNTITNKNTNIYLYHNSRGKLYLRILNRSTDEEWCKFLRHQLMLYMGSSTKIYYDTTTWNGTDRTDALFFMNNLKDVESDYTSFIESLIDSDIKVDIIRTLDEAISEVLILKLNQ